jgi:hypothetical protein
MPFQDMPDRRESLPPVKHRSRLVLLIEKATNRVETIFHVEGSSLLPDKMQKRLAHAGFILREQSSKEVMDSEEWQEEVDEFLRAVVNPTTPSPDKKGKRTRIAHDSACICLRCNTKRHNAKMMAQNEQETIKMNLFHEINHSNVGRTQVFFASRTWDSPVGRITVAMVGRRLYVMHDEFLQMENDEQYQERLSKQGRKA